MAGTRAEVPFLRDHLADLAPGGALEGAARLVAVLNPEHEALSRAVAILDLIARDAEAALAGVDGANTFAERVRGWLTPRTGPPPRTT